MASPVARRRPRVPTRPSGSPPALRPGGVGRGGPRGLRSLGDAVDGIEHTPRGPLQQRHAHTDRLGPLTGQPAKAPGGVRQHERVGAWEQFPRHHRCPPAQLGQAVGQQLDGRENERGRLGRAPALEGIQRPNRSLCVGGAGEAVHRVRKNHHDLSGEDGIDRARDLVVHRRPSTTRSRPVRSVVTRRSW